MSLMSTSESVDTVLVDARALQDSNYRFRGVGQHSASLLSALRNHVWPGQRPRLVAMTDHRAEGLHVDHASLFDDVTTTVRAPRRGRTEFLSLSPMTHDPVWLSTLLLDPTIFKVALFYDLIPLDLPYRYLRDLNSRADYLVCFAWLGRFDAFAAISDDTRRSLVRARGVEEGKIFVTGVAVRPSLEPSPDETPLPRAARTHILVSGGGDPRKNPECVLRAHAASSAAREAGLSIKVFGNYSPSARSELRSIYADAGGQAGDLVFLPHLSDAEMREAYRAALVTVVPSRAEGFSIPIVESAAAGTPALVSDVGAHPELVADTSLRFSPDEPDILRGAMDRLIGQSAAWARARDAMSGVWPRYTEEAVGTRFVEGILRRRETAPAAPALLRYARPRIAVLTPLPPATSGVADYSAVTLKAMSRYADLDIFTDSPGAVPEPHYASMGSVREARFSARRFDATLSVLGNSDHHVGIFDFLLERGGAALAHDARMLGFYKYLLGDDRALSLARRETGSEVELEKMLHWLRNENELPTLFLSEIAAAADPLLVHSPTTAGLIKSYYGVDAKVLPFSQYRSFDLDRPASEAIRSELGWSPGEVVICSFGLVAPDKAADVMLWAVRLLRDWGIRARLVLCGAVDTNYVYTFQAMIGELGIKDCVQTFEKGVDERFYASCLGAADAAIQLRTYYMGSLSGALNDCVAAGLPTVASSQLANAMDAPSFVRRVPDSLSPVLVAEAILAIVGSSSSRQDALREAAAFAETHSPDVYARQVMAALDFSLDEIGVE